MSKYIDIVEREQTFNKIKKEKGITLVALIITIIILLILSGISILALTESGLFEKTQLAKDKTKKAQEDENSTINDYTKEIGKYINGEKFSK